jgi:hypothetical protein
MESKQTVRRIVGLQDQALGIGCKDGHWAAIHQHLQLLLGRSPGFTFRFNLFQMDESGLAAADHFKDEEPHAEKRGENENIARDAGAGPPVERIETFGEQRAKSGYYRDLPAL